MTILKTSSSVITLCPPKNTTSIKSAGALKSCGAPKFLLVSAIKCS